MRKFAVLLLLALTLTTLAACAGASDTSLPPYGVDDRFIGFWYQEVEEAEEKSEETKAVAGSEEAIEAVTEVEAKQEIYFLFLPNGKVYLYYREGGEVHFYNRTWYTADTQVLMINDRVFEYSFKGGDTLTISCTESNSEYNAATGEYEYTYTTETQTLKRSDKHPADLPY